ncbi:MAG: DsrE family protein [Arenicellales bacterium]|jgi:intracellular sulfur oxidation DsrE/DsrF family protein
MILTIKKIFLVLLIIFPAQVLANTATFIETPYKEPQVVYDFYFNEPEDINSALYWIRSLMNSLMDAPYNIDPEMMDIVVVIHGMEIVTVASKNYQRYKAAVDRMRYFSELGVSFKVCGLAAGDYGYTTEDFQDFIEVVPSAINELVHWQQQGYALITPTILSKIYSIEDIR